MLLPLLGLLKVLKSSMGSPSSDGIDDAADGPLERFMASPMGQTLPSVESATSFSSSFLTTPLSIFPIVTSPFATPALNSGHATAWGASTGEFSDGVSAMRIPPGRSCANINRRSANCVLLFGVADSVRTKNSSGSMATPFLLTPSMPRSPVPTKSMPMVPRIPLIGVPLALAWSMAPSTFMHHVAISKIFSNMPMPWTSTADEGRLCRTLAVERAMAKGKAKCMLSCGAVQLRRAWRKEDCQTMRRSHCCVMRRSAFWIAVGSDWTTSSSASSSEPMEGAAVTGTEFVGRESEEGVDARER